MKFFLLLKNVSYNFKGCVENSLYRQGCKALWGPLPVGGATFSCASLYLF